MVGNLSFLCVCTNDGTCEVSCWFCVPVFEVPPPLPRAGLTGAKLWENVGRRGVGWGKKFGDCFKVMTRG